MAKPSEPRRIAREAKMSPRERLPEKMGQQATVEDQHRINEAMERRATVIRQARNQTYRALVSLVAAVAKIYSSPREALEMIQEELGKIEKDVIKAEKKVARRSQPKGDTSLEGSE